MIVYNFLALCLANVIAFCRQDLGKNGQGFDKTLAGAAKILSNSLHIRERQECSGVRRSSRKRTTIIKSMITRPKDKIGEVGVYCSPKNARLGEICKVERIPLSEEG